MPNNRLASSSLRASGWRTVSKLSLAASVALVTLFAASEASNIFPEMNKDGFAQSLRQTAWTKALSGQTGLEAWPWQSLSPPMSHLPSAKVRRLGLSASLRDMNDDASEIGSPLVDSQSLARRSNEQRDTEGNVALGDVALGDAGSGTVSIGDSITFTANDGATCVYRVTGRPVVDPHLDLGRAGEATGETGLFDCSPLDTLLMRATTQEMQKVTPDGPAEEQQRKL